MDTLVVDSIGKVDRRSWDELVGNDNFFNSHQWLSSLERTRGEAPVLLATSQGAVTGGVATWRGTGDEPGALVTPLKFRADLPGPWRHEVLWLGARRPVFNDLLCTGGPGRRETMAALLDRARVVAYDSGLGAVVMPYTPLSTALELAGARPDVSVVLHSADATIAVPPAGAGPQFAGARHKDRKEWRREQRIFQSEGNVAKWFPMTEDVVAEIVPLIAQTRERYGSKTDSESLVEFFTAQRTAGLLDGAVACVCERDGRTVAGAVFYRYRDELYGLFVGFGYEHVGRGFQYFTLVFYEAVAWAQEHGVRRYRLAFSSYAAKVARGASLRPLAAVVLPAAEPPADPALIDAHNTAMTSWFRDRFGHRTQALTDDWALVGQA
ncbi:GNAT family N-acetyltransferase [Amycolatopsis carbonis]|uniref:GNAT family N-acetyltransferase n=1 Tax=Amycolatopsis carbonis TaxID=715471 RepID=A0A9Y2IAH2_9PSEU|nr:GNAT family N-acetyltransferase [Amycolatopsis sp. 2-15]WIX75676.1 GNAT family N-acetyltransferase [Amycolatopsis sp. 2-15]